MTKLSYLEFYAKIGIKNKYYEFKILLFSNFQPNTAAELYSNNLSWFFASIVAIIS